MYILILCVLACRLEGGELFDYVIAKDYLQENEGSYYMKQILEGLAFCHMKNIVHLDLKVCACAPLVLKTRHVYTVTHSAFKSLAFIM